ncbi:Heavy metal transport/detoxification superfamily protein [Forsythia ovata]|uniref:Heavy metal transport/detoxification superfamily protein n=1 Tax=Forsythia ovata TaxID=205694 RepID=A0ABD1WZC2_9LAMI
MDCRWYISSYPENTNGPSMVVVINSSILRSNKRVVRMGKLSFGRVLDRLCFFSGCGSGSGSGSSLGSCLCIRTNYGNQEEEEEEFEKKPLIAKSDEVAGPLMKLKDIIAGTPSLAFQLKPKMVVLRVSMHCNGCARQIKKHIAKMEGVSSYQVDLETKMVVVTGDIVPFQVLESISKVKAAELWNTPSSSPLQ